MRIVHVTHQDVEDALEKAPMEARNVLDRSQLFWLCITVILIALVSYVTKTAVSVVVMTAIILWYGFCIGTVLLLSKGKG